MIHTKLTQLLIDAYFQPGIRDLPPRSDRVRKLATAMKVDYKGRKIQTFHWENNGPLVYMAHGWGSRGLRFFYLVDRLYEAGFSVFTFDGVAHGESEGKSTSFIEFTDLNYHLLSKMETPKLLIGHSMGGAALINVAHELKIDVPMVMFAPMFSIAKVVENIKRRSKIPDFVVDQMIRTIEKKVGRKTADLETIDKVGNFQAPALILHDPEDDMTYWENSEALAAAWPNCKLEPAVDCGHSKIIRDQGMADRVLAFMK